MIAPQEACDLNLLYKAELLEVCIAGEIIGFQKLSADEVASDVIDGKLNPFHHDNDKEEAK